MVLVMAYRSVEHNCCNIPQTLTMTLILVVYYRHFLLSASGTAQYGRACQCYNIMLSPSQFKVLKWLIFQPSMRICFFKSTLLLVSAVWLSDKRFWIILFAITLTRVDILTYRGFDLGLMGKRLVNTTYWWQTFVGTAKTRMESSGDRTA